MPILLCAHRMANGQIILPLVKFVHARKCPENH